MIEIRGLDYQYPGENKVLHEIDLQFQGGKIYGILGQNGQGKSTLMKLLSGLLFPKAGAYKLNNVEFTRHQVAIRQQVFLVPEDFELPALKVRTYQKINAPFYPEFSPILFHQLIDDFQLSLEDKISDLSFGQKKKVLIAFAVATKVKYLLLDEPTNGLDIHSKSQFRKILVHAVDTDRCIIISTHQVRDLNGLLDQIVILDQSKVVFNQPLTKISQQLWFGKSTPSATHLIYSEGYTGGKCVRYREQSEETEVDLELLYQAVLVNQHEINRAFQSMTV